MALELSLTEDGIAISQDGTTLSVTDQTGEYNAVTNTGGWGAPNVELDQSALMVYVEKYKDTTNDVLSPKSSQIVYDNAASNQKQTNFTFTLDDDGYHLIYLIRLQVSTDGTNNLEGAAISTGEYFYYSNVVHQKTALGADVITDYSVLVDEDNVNAPTQSLYRHLVMAQLAVAWKGQYKAYKDARNEYDGTEDTERTKAINFLLDKVGASEAFDEGNWTQAENIVETLVEDYVS